MIRRISLIFCAAIFFWSTPAFAASASKPALVLQTGHRVEDNAELTAAFSSDGKWLASATGNATSSGELLIRNAKNEVWFREDGLPQINSLSWSSNGKYLALGCSGEARIFEMATTRFVARVSLDDANENTFDSPESIVWLDNSRLVFALDRGDLISWNFATGQKVLLRRAERNFWLAMQLSPDAKTLAVSGRDGVLLFATSTATPGFLRALNFKFTSDNFGPNTTFDPVILAWSPDSKLVGGYNNDGQFLIWKAGSGAVLKTQLKTPEGELGSETKLLKIDNSGRVKFQLTQLEAGKWRRFDDSTIAKNKTRLINLASPLEDGWSESALAVSSDGTRILSADHSGTLFWHDATTGRLLDRNESLSQWANAVDWSSDGNYLAVGYGRTLRSGSSGEVVIYDAKTGALVQTLAAHIGADIGETGVNDLAFSPDRKHLVSTASTPDGYYALRIWETGSWKLVRTVGDLDRGVRIQFSNDGKILAVGCDGKVLVWRSFEKLLRDGGKPDLSLNVESKDSQRQTEVSARALAISPDNRTLLVGCEGSPESRFSAWDLTSGKLKSEIPMQRANLQEIAFERNGRTFWTGDANGGVLQWDAASLKIIKTIATSANYCAGVVLSRDEKFLVAGLDNAPAIFSLPDGKRLKTLNDAKSFFNDIALSPTGVLVAGADETGTISIWNARTGKRAVSIYRLNTSRDKTGNLSTRAVAVAPDGNYLADAQSEKFLRWRVGEKLLTAQELAADSFGSTPANTEAVAQALAER